jgi:hypothetical protein
MGQTSGGSGSYNPTTMLWIYRPKSDSFEQAFSHYSGATNNEETRLLTDGPLSGYIILSHAPGRAPYRYGITVYRPSKSGKYVEVLEYTGKTKYGDGYPLAVIDSEMLEIERRLHVWKPGNPLPAPREMPDRCTTIELRNGVEWCH